MDDIAVREAAPTDRAAVLHLLGSSLGWGDDAQFEEFFAWKHERNPFGASPAWVAVDAGHIVGLRTFLRWEFVDPRGDVVRAARAVDTATHPQFQGRGIFRTLTLRALEELESERVSFVFNTPNAQSRPGYLGMGWSVVGRLPTSVRFRSPIAALRTMRARVPAERWSDTSDAGRPAPDVLAAAGLEELLASMDPGAGLRTHRTPAYLRWRYGFAPLRYRAVTVSDRTADGVAIFRRRRRGPASEIALCELLVPRGDARATHELVRAVSRASGDYVIRIGGPPLDRFGFVRLIRQGPILTWRPLAADVSDAPPHPWNLGLGDIELF